MKIILFPFCSRSAELKFLSSVIEKVSKKKLPSHWAAETRVTNDNRKLKKQVQISLCQYEIIAERRIWNRQ